MNRSEYRPLVVLAIIGIVLYFAVVAWNMKAGEPLEDSSTRPPVSREQAEARAGTFLKGLGVDLAGTAKMEAVYQSDKTASAYLEREELTDQYDEKQLDGKIPLDYWQVLIDSGKDRYMVNIGLMKDEVSGWTKKANAAAVQSTDKLEAEKAVVAAGYSLGSFEYTQPAARSNTHTFVSINPVIGEAKQQLLVEVKQGELTGFQTKLVVPDSFNSWYSQQKTLASRLSYGSLAGTVILAIAALVLVIIKAKLAAWARGIFLSLVFAGAYILHTFNSIPAVEAEAGITVNSAINILYIVFTIGVIFLLAVALYFSAVSGEQLWRGMGRPAWERWREEGYGRHVWHAMTRGYLICLFILGVQQVLFAAAEHSFHSFAINDPSQSILNMRWPALFPTLAWMAGISEEITFRLFGIAVIRLLVRNNFLAVLLSGFVWALGHAAYTIYPSYTRLFEVTVLGLIFGYTFLRYGLITAIFAHVIMDSILMAMSIMLTGSAVNVLAGVGYIVAPAAVAGVIYVLHRWLWRPRQPRPA